MHALVQDGTITQVGPLPHIWHDGERWWDYRDGQHDPTGQGWREVQRAPRPADDTTAHDWSVELVDGVPVETWTPRAWTPAEQADRAEQAARFDSIEQRLERIEAKLWPPVDPDAEVPATVPTMADYGGIWPAEQLLSDGGKVWRNVTTVPLTTPPSGFPGAPSQWTRLFVEHGGAIEPEPEPGRPEGYVGAWSASADYKIGDIVDRDGTYYRAKVAHGAAYAGTWGPPLPSVWDVVGPVA